jgi:hypothetical protein
VFSLPTVQKKTQQKFTFRLDLFSSNRLALHILSISVFVEFVCLCVQLLLVTCVLYLFSIFSCNPSFISAPHPSATSCAHLSRCRLSVAPSLFRGAVGQKRKEKRMKVVKKEKNQKRETAAQP